MLWELAAAAGGVAVIAGLADRRRNRRRDLDRVGWVPWPLIALMATLLALVFTAFALHA